MASLSLINSNNIFTLRRKRQMLRIVMTVRSIDYVICLAMILKSLLYCMPTGFDSSIIEVGKKDLNAFIENLMFLMTQ